MGMQLPPLINNTSFQQYPGQYSWLSYSQKHPLINQQINFNNPFEQNKSLGDWQKFVEGINRSNENPIDYLNGLSSLSGGVSNVLNQATSTISSSTSSPVVKAVSAAVNGIGQNVIKSVGSNVSKEVSSQLGKSVLKGGLSNLSVSGLKTAAKQGLGSAFNAKSLGGVALSVANQFAPQKREYSGDKGNLTKGLDSAYDTLSDAVSVIPVWGQAASLIMKGGALAGKFVNKWGGGTDSMTNTDAILGSNFLNLTPLGLINGFGGKNADKFNYNTAADKVDRNYVAGSYNMGLFDDAIHKSGKKYGLFSSGARNKANDQIYDANNKAQTLRAISSTGQFRNTFGNATQNINTVDYQKKLQGYQPTYLHAGKHGMKIEKEEEFIIPDISNFKPIIATEEEVKKFKDGGSFNIIPEGALHARKNNMEVENITKKGIPVVDKDGVQQAEIERDEIIFRKEVTDAIEEARKDGSDKKAIEIGKLLVKEIFNNTQDNTGLIENLTNETPTVKEQVENHEVFPVEKKQNGGKIPYQEWLKTVPQDRLSDNFDLEKAYQVLPKEMLEAWRTSSVQDLKNGKNHLKSVYEMPNGDFEFLKLGNEKINPEIIGELNWFNGTKDGAPEFRNKYNLSFENGRYYYRKKTIPKNEKGGLLDQINNLDLNKLNVVEKDTLLQLLLQKASL